MHERSGRFWSNEIAPASALAVLLLITALVSLTLGQYSVSLLDILSFLSDRWFHLASLDAAKSALLENVLLDIRLPRVLAALLIGAALSIAGTALQAVFTNPLVSPKMMGILAGSSFGSALGVLLANQWFVVQASAILFGFIAVGVAVGIAGLHRNESILMLVLGGIISDTLFHALFLTVQFVADPYTKLPVIVHWLMGNLGMADRSTVLIVSIPMLAGIGILGFCGKHLNALSMGDEEARTLGVNVRLVRLGVIFLSTLVTSLTVMMGGGSMVGWVGLIIPHIARMVVGPNNVALLPASALMGATYLLIMDDVSRLAFRFELPIGIVTSLVGIPFFIYVLKNARKGWS